MNLSEANLTLGQVNLGTLDAEADRKLSEYFVKTPYVSLALKLKRSLYLGRKGSGKSALFTQLPRLMKDSNFSRTRVVSITPDQYAWSALQSYQESGIIPEQAHTNAWKFTIAIEIASNALTHVEPISLSPKAEASLRIIKKFVGDNFGETRPSMMITAGKLIKGIKSFNLSAFGFGAGMTRDIPEQAQTPQIIEALYDQIYIISREGGFLVCLDKLDDFWDGTPNSKNFLVGLLKASKEINDRFKGGDPDKGIFSLVFLRSDIYEGLQFDDKDKHRSTEEAISWTPDLLRDMVNKRLPAGVTVDELFEPGEMRGSIKPFNYIVKRTFLRPREILQYLEECVRRAGDDAHVITKDQVRSAEDRYSVWKVEDLKQEYRRLFPEFDDILESLRQGQHRYDSIEELEIHLNQKLSHLVNSVGIRRIIELMFNSSVIGVRLGNSGSPRFRSDDSDLVLPTEGAVYVHQCLHKGLNIREKRARDNSDE